MYLTTHPTPPATYTCPYVFNLHTPPLLLHNVCPKHVFNPPSPLMLLYPFICLIHSQTVLVTAAAGALGLATVDIAANILQAKVCSF